MTVGWMVWIGSSSKGLRLSEAWLQGYQTQLEQLQAQGLERHLRVCASASEPVVELDGKRVVQFASNNYLGLATHPVVIVAAQKALQR